MLKGNDRKIVRELAKQVRDRAELPEMEKRRELWYRHNDLETTRPVIATFPEGSWHEIIPPESLRCEDEEARFMETILRGKLFRADVIQDDVPIEKTWEVTKIITDDGWIAGGHASVSNNPDYRDNCLGGINYLWRHDYKFNPNAGHFEPVIMEPSDLKRIKTPKVTYHEKASLEKLAIHQDALGDILDVQFRGQKWLYFAMMETYTNLRGLQEVMEDIYEEPEMLEDGMQMIADGYIALLDQYVKYDLLDLNNDQSYSGSGGLNYTRDLPKYPGGAKDTRNFWGFCESQEFTMAGPEQHWQFVMKHEAKMAERFGLFSYGCCEPVDKKLKYILTIPGIRRISVSPWADVEACARQIQNKAIYSWKPMPSTFINSFDSMEPLVRRMLEAAKANGCCPEIVLKDTNTCNNDPESFGRFTRLCRRLIEEYHG